MWTPCTCSQAQEGGSLQTSFSDIDPSWLSNGTNTAAKSCENEQQADGSPTCQCGKGMSDCSIHPNTPERWLASMRDSLARTLVLLESRQAYLREPDQVFTEKSCVLLTRYDPNISSWRTSQQSFLTDSEPFSETWPRWGMTQDGAAFAHPMSERRITETDGFVLPTPTVTSGAQVAWKPTKGQTGGTTLEGWARWFPTPTARMWRGGGQAMIRKDGRERSDSLDWLLEAQEPNGRLNPDWVEWLMGFPIDYTVLKHSAMPKSRSKRQSHGNSLEAHD